MDKEIFYLVSWLLVAFGWIVSFNLAYVTFKRAEVRKAVDAIVDNLEKCSSVASKAWLESSISEGMFDQEISAIVSRINIYNSIISVKVGYHFVSDDDFVNIYNISDDFRSCLEGDIKSYDVSEKIHASDIVCSDMIYRMESLYYEYSMSKSLFDKFVSFPKRHSEYFGGGLALLMIVAIYFVITLVSQ